MPSDPARALQVVAALAPLVEQYRGAIAATLEDVRSRLAHTASAGEASSRLQSELGEFAAGRVDARRLSVFLGDRARLPTTTVARLERAAATLDELAAEGGKILEMELGRGEDLVAAVRQRLGKIGRAFRAARLVASATDGGPVSAADEGALLDYPFSQWSAAERRLAPPLVVSVHGEDYRPAGLAEFLDGRLKMVLLVEPPAPVAPLVRLITPGVFVAQSSDLSLCAQVVDWPGAAIVAIVPEQCAQFVHDPAAGPELWQRVRLSHAPTPTARAGAYSSAQQIEDLRQLMALAARPAVTEHATRTGAPHDAVDRVAAWLLDHANVRGGGGS